MPTWRALPFIVLPVCIGLVAAVVTLDQRHSGDVFNAQQRPLRAYDQRGAVERLVGTAPAPTAPRTNGKGAASCTPGNAGPLQNPWTCTLRYPTGLTVRYQVTISPNGSYFGRGPTSKSTGLTETIHGCCLKQAD